MSDVQAEEFAKLASELQAAPTVVETADQVVAFARHQLDADEAGLTIIHRGGRLETVAPTAPVVEQIDRLQYEFKEGTCFEATWESETMRAPDLASDPRWPNWGPHAVALGVASALAVELATEDGHRIGSLNLYWGEPRTFSLDDVAFAQVFGRHAAVALSSILTEVNLRTALDTRKRIGQAQGILMERFGLDESRAFEVLRRYSQDHNEKLHAVAERLVATRQLPSASDDVSSQAAQG